MLKFLKRFYSYQKERFPLVVLILSLLPAVLSSGAIISLKFSGFELTASLVAAILYLLHIRVIDENRDFQHDNKHHSTRPLQMGLITTTELKRIDIGVIIIFLSIAVWFGVATTILGLAMLVYSYAAEKEFFMAEKVRSHYFFYNSINLLQMLLMQIFIYGIFASSVEFKITAPLFIHFIFTSLGTLIFEFIRKLKLPGQDGTGMDTYTWYLGFGRAICIYIFLFCFDGVLFYKLATLFSTHWVGWLVFTLGFLGLASLSAFAHWQKKTHLTEQLLVLFFLLIYGAFNVAIYYLRLH